MKNRGISLIVLIITIVVIIILATAIIVNLAQTNIINNAKEATVKQDFKTMQDELTLYMADEFVNTDGKFKAEDIDVTVKSEIEKILPSIKGTKYEDYVVIEDGKLAIVDTMPEPEKTWAMEALGLVNTSNNLQTQTPVVAVNTTVKNANCTITGDEFSYNNPVIPVGFRAVNTTKASWLDENDDGIVDGWNDGLVLMDSDGNEYIWIPVDGSNVKYEKWDDEIEVANTTVKKAQVEDDTLPSGVTSETYQITKYGGFYVARYEAGLPDEQTTETLMSTKTFSATDNNRTDIGKPQSKSGKIVWNNIDYNNAKIVAENVISTNYVQSGLVTGTQWDTMLTFLSQEVDVDTNSISWGNYYNKYGYTTLNGYYSTSYAGVVYTKGEYTKSGEGYALYQTGMFGSVVAEGTPKNLYDVAGNVWEWTAETASAEGVPVSGAKLVRGGSCNNNGSIYVASIRNGNNVATKTISHLGFRFVLYIK